MFDGAPPRHRSALVLTLLVLLALFSLVLASVVGSVALSWVELWDGVQQLWHGQAGLAGTLLQLRLGRGLLAFSVGAALALAGVLMQALLRNPLADPYVLGVSGGAAVGALFAMLFVSVAWIIDLAAFGGALALAALLFGLTRRALHQASEDQTLLLSGVVLAAGCGALVTLMLSLAPDQRLRGMVFWLIGDLSGSQWRVWPWLVLLALLLLALRAARAINLLAMQAELASTLGIAIGPLRRALFVAAALLTATAVSSAGSIGFVGLIVPHACRFALGPDHRLLLPAATLVGGIFLVLADTVARSVIAPQQLPVGVITALIGVPIFLLQLQRMRTAQA